MTTPLVTINCITYNHESYIRETIEGFLMQQTSFGIEILIHDDASTDRTADIIREYEQKYPELIFPIYQTENQYSKGGKPHHFNGERARGKYLAYCEGDDYWTDPTKLQKQVDFLEAHPDYSFTYCRFRKLNQDTGEFLDDINGSYFNDGEDAIEFDFEKFYKGWDMGTQTLVYRISMCDPNYALNYKYAKDIHLIVHLLTQGKGACLNFFGAVYRKHSGGVFSGASDYQNARLSYLCYKEIYEQNRQVSYLKLKLIKFTQFYIDKLLINKEYVKAFIKSIEIFIKNRDIKWFVINLANIYKTIG
jgi:glycosyltransferase involved in cell wall biosynthesis